MTINQVLNFLNSAAPLTEAEGFDNVGLLIGSEEAEVTGVCCCLDITHGVIEEAAEKGASLIVSHHPVIFNGLKRIPDWEPAVMLIRRDIAAIAMHTNFDKADGGVNDTLCRLLELESAGCGNWSKFDGGFGQYCDITKEFTPKVLAEYIKSKLDLGGVRYSRVKRPIKRIAVCCGGGVSYDTMREARELNIDAVISGDIKHNFWIEAENCGITLIDAGHYGTEYFAADRLAELIAAEFPNIKVFAAECEQDPCGYL